MSSTRLDLNWWALTWPFLLLGSGIVLGLLIWQGVTGAGNPDPTAQHIGSTAAVLDTAILVFREGLETILVLAAITASMLGTNRSLRAPVAAGAGFGLLATCLTWVGAVLVLDAVQQTVPVYTVQAATGLLAVLVLVTVMNWFFHRVYWTGWITIHNRRKKSLIDRVAAGSVTRQRLMWGLVFLGFASIYREGFEIVLFLQTLRLQVGSLIVGEGVAIGASLTAFVGALTFLAHHRLPYKRMLVFTGVLLGAVLLVMVGEEVQEMQLAHWIGTTDLNWPIPAWAGVWFSVFPTVETMVGQGLAALAVLGSYFGARYVLVWRQYRLGGRPASRPDQPPAASLHSRRLPGAQELPPALDTSPQ